MVNSAPMRAYAAKTPDTVSEADTGQATDETVGEDDSGTASDADVGDTATAVKEAGAVNDKNKSRTSSDKGSDEAEEESGFNVIKFRSNTILRREPSADSDKVIVVPLSISLRSDKKVTDGNGTVWYKVTYADFTGYVSEDMVSVNETDEAEKEVDSSASKSVVMSSADQTADENVLSDTISEEESSEELSEDMDTDTGVEQTMATRKNRVDIVLLFLIILAIAVLVATAFVFLRLRMSYMKFRKRVIRVNRKRLKMLEQSKSQSQTEPVNKEQQENVSQ